MGIIGDRVDLERVVWVGDAENGQFEVAYLCLTEVDERRHITVTIAFDVGDWRAALAQTVSRALAVDTAAATLRPVYEFFLGWNDHDPARVRAAVADDLVVHDHRLAGLGLVEGADAYVESLAALWRLAPDIGINVAFELARECYGVVRAIGGIGTLPEGGAFERPMVTVQVVAGGRITRYEAFEIEDAAAALARFEELRPANSKHETRTSKQIQNLKSE